MSQILSPPPTSDEEDRSLQILRRLPQPRALTRTQRARLGARLAALPASTRRRFGGLAWGAVALAGVTLLASRWLGPERPHAVEHVVLSRCGSVELTHAHARIALAGPGEATVDGNVVRLRSGHLSVDSGAEALRVTAPGARVLVPPHAAAQIEVRELRVIVAASSAAVTVEWMELGEVVETLQIAPGSARTRSGPALLPSAASCPGALSAAPEATSPKVAPDVQAANAVLQDPAPRKAARGTAHAAQATALPPPSEEPSAPKEELAPSSLEGESRLLAAAVRTLHVGDARAALTILDGYDAQFPSGLLGPEAARLRAACRREIDR